MAKLLGKINRKRMGSVYLTDMMEGGGNKETDYDKLVKKRKAIGSTMGHPGSTGGNKKGTGMSLRDMGAKVPVFSGRTVENVKDMTESSLPGEKTSKDPLVNKSGNKYVKILRVPSKDKARKKRW